MPDIDMKAIREEHGLAQAKAETEMKRAVGNRFATISLEQGHRRGFWEGVEFALAHTGELLDGRGEAEALYPLDGAAPDIVFALRSAYRAGVAREGRAAMTKEVVAHG